MTEVFRMDSMVCAGLSKASEWRGDGGARPRNVETTGARVSFRPRNIFPDFCMLFLKFPLVIYLVFYSEMHDNCHYVAYN